MHPVFLGKGPIPLLCADSPAARVKFPINGTPNHVSCLIFIVYVQVISKCGQGPHNRI